MLNRLAIRNLVIVRELELGFSNGMSALTGETGAGKSILIDALGLALGERTDNSMIRNGCERAEVSAEFDLADCPPALRKLASLDLADGTSCLLRRVLVRDGRSRAYINGSPTPLAQLRELGELLLDIHGQHAHQSLLRANAQRDLLDAYGGLQAMAQETAARHQALNAASREREQLRQAASDRANRLDYLAYQLNELEPLCESAQGIATLESDHRRLAHAEKLQQETQSLLYALADDEQDINSLLSSLGRRLQGLAELDDDLAEARDLLDSAAIQVDEAAQSLRHYIEGIEIDPQQLLELDNQLSRLHDAARKHHVDIQALPGLAEQLQAEFEQLQHADRQLGDLDKQIDQLRQAYDEQASALGAARREAAARLAETVTASMQQLGMQGGVFSVLCDSDPANPSRHGNERVQFLVAANPGQPAAPLSSVASGGELSRISLAIQVATANCGEVPTLIFDEVDVGIGGAVAEIVGQLLRRLGSERQVLCVTHLAQVASQAHQHYRVQKTSNGNQTETRIARLEPEGRVDEVARMIGGVDITEQTLRHAGEMIEKAQAG